MSLFALPASHKKMTLVFAKKIPEKTQMAPHNGGQKPQIKIRGSDICTPTFTATSTTAQMWTQPEGSLADMINAVWCARMTILFGVKKEENSDI